jgi:V-type H+-transporting ATPase subunit a
MYGDLGHATCLFIFSVFLVIKEKQLKKSLGELTSMIFAGRYLLVGMSFFGIYCGLIYNDYFALGLNLFGSTYELPEDHATDRKAEHKGGAENVYPVGLDPAWHIAENSLQFSNR